MSLIILCKNLLPSSCSSCIAPFRGCQNPINGLLTVCAAKHRDQLRDPTLSNRVRHKVVTDCGLYTLSYRFYRPTRSRRMKKLTPAKYRIYNSVGLHCTPLKYGTNSCICISLYDAGLPFCFSSTSLQSHVYSIRRWTKAISSQNYGLFVGRPGTAPVGCCFPPRAGSYTGHKSHWTQRSRQPANCFIDSTEANLLSVRGGGKKAPTYLRKFIGEETKRQVSVSSSHLVNRFFIYLRRFTCGICDDSFIPSLNQTIRKCVCFTR